MSRKSFFTCRSNVEALQLLKEHYGLKHEDIVDIEKSDVPSIKVDFSNKDYWSISPEIAYHNGKPTVLIPNIFNRFFYFDENGKKRKAPKQKDEDWNGCYRFFEPLPDGVFTSKMLYSYLFRHISPSNLIYFAVLSVLAILAGLIFPIISDKILTFADNNTDISTLLLYGLYGVIAIVASAFLHSLTLIFQTRIGQKLYFNSYNAIMKRIFELPIYTLESTSHADTVEISIAIYNHITAISEIVLSGLVSVCFIVAYLWQLSTYLHAHTLWVLLYMLIGSALLGYLVLVLNQSSRKARGAAMKEKRFLVSSLEGIKKIRQTGSEIRFIEKWNTIFDVFSKNDCKTFNSINIQSSYSAFSIYLLTFFLLILSYFTKSSVNNFIVINIIGGCLLTQNGSFANQLLNIVDAVSSWNVLSSFLSKPQSVPISLPALPSFDGSLHIDNLSYTYEDSKSVALTNLSIDVPKNEYLAIVGKSGCGKSTLLNLIIGRLMLQEGSIKFGEYAIQDYDRTSILSNIGIVMQDDVLIPGSIRDNLTLYCPNADEETLWNALKDACFYEDVFKMPYKLDTVVAGNLSGGQMQRLMLARVIVAKPKMIILDEATSALDNISQRVIKETLDKLQCTKIIVAHRLSTIKDCDRILVMDKGRIVEEGTYKELVDKHGLFSEIVERQRLDK